MNSPQQQRTRDLLLWFSLSVLSFVHFSARGQNSVDLDFPLDQEYESWQLRYFDWEYSADTFHVEIGLDEAFSELLIDVRTPYTHYQLPNLLKDDGRYFWRVSPVGEEGAGSNGTFTIRNGIYKVLTYTNEEGAYWYYNSDSSGLALVRFDVSENLNIKDVNVIVEYETDDTETVEARLGTPWHESIELSWAHEFEFFEDGKGIMIFDNESIYDYHELGDVSVYGGTFPYGPDSVAIMMPSELIEIGDRDIRGEWQVMFWARSGAFGEVRRASIEFYGFDKDEYDSLSLDFPREETFKPWEATYLSWTIDQADTFHVMLSEDEGFAKLLLDTEVVDARHLELDGHLSPGQYWWRVATTLRGEPVAKENSFEVSGNAGYHTFSSTGGDNFYLIDYPHSQKIAEIDIPVTKDLLIEDFNIELDFQLDVAWDLYSHLVIDLIDPMNKSHRLISLDAGAMEGATNFELRLDDDAYLNLEDHGQSIYEGIHFEGDSVLVVQSDMSLDFFKTVNSEGDWKVRMEVQGDGYLHGASIQMIGDPPGMDASVVRGDEGQAVLLWEDMAMDEYVVTLANAKFVFDTLAIVEGSELSYQHEGLEMDARYTYRVQGVKSDHSITSNVAEYFSDLHPISELKMYFVESQVDQFTWDRYWRVTWYNPNQSAQNALLVINSQQAEQIEIDGLSRNGYYSTKVYGDPMDVRLAVFHAFDTTNWLTASGTLNVEAKEVPFYVAPNPAVSGAMLHNPSGKDAQVWLMDASGKIWMSEKVNEYDSVKYISMAGLSGGIYFLKIETSERVQVIRIIKL